MAHNMARVHKLYNIFCFFHILFTLSISSHDHVVNGVPDILQDFDEDWAIFSTKTDELNASVVVTRGRHFESLFSSVRWRRFHQVRVTYYTNSSATFNLDYLLHVETFKLTLVLAVTSKNDLALTTGLQRIFFIVCHSMQGQSAVSWMSSSETKKRWTWLQLLKPGFIKE